MSSVAKLALGIGGVGAVGGGIGYGMYALNKTEEQKISLKIKLTSEGFDANVTESEWTEIEKAHDKSQNKFTIPDGITDKKTWLKNHCNELLGKEDTSNYSKAIQWCVKKEKIVDILKKANSKFRTLVTQETITPEEKIIWNQKITALGQDANSNSKKALGVELNGDENAKIKKVQGKCQTIIGTETIGEKFEENFKLAKDWCSTAK